jgi:ubiquinone/menaquinone biosynthesis C-methylase UbiE
MIKQVSGNTGRSGLRARLFAWLSSLGESPQYAQIVDPYKRALFSQLSGTVLEIGAGTGTNFALYPPDIQWIGVEPNVHMHSDLLKAAEEYGIRGEIHTGVAERLPVDDASVDAVVSTLVLCSVSDQVTVLGEILRVLRPAGRYVFVEHVAAPEHTRLRWMQTFVKPAWRAVSDGCEPDRDTAAAIRRAGFSSVEMDGFRAPLSLASPHIAGTATK